MYYNVPSAPFMAFVELMLWSKSNRLDGNTEGGFEGLRLARRPPLPASAGGAADAAAAAVAAADLDEMNPENSSLSLLNALVN